MFTKKRVVFLILMAAVLIIAPVLTLLSISRSSPADERMQVINLWQIDSFEGGRGSRAQYLKNTAEECFEGTRTYITVTTLSADAARQNIAGGNIPDIISYGAGFYGIETLINPRDFTYKTWCRGGYVYITLDEDADFSDINDKNTVINSGRDNYSAICAAFEGLSRCDSAAPTSAYVKLIAGEYKYLLGTQRDLYRMETREKSYKARAVTSFNDLYQNISILTEGENYDKCAEFVNFLMRNSSRVSTLGMVADGASCEGALEEIRCADCEYKIEGFASEAFIKQLNGALINEDLNSLKNLLK